MSYYRMQCNICAYKFVWEGDASKVLDYKCPCPCGSDWNTSVLNVSTDLLKGWGKPVAKIPVEEEQGLCEVQEQPVSDEWREFDGNILIRKSSITSIRKDPHYHEYFLTCHIITEGYAHAVECDYEDLKAWVMG